MRISDWSSDVCSSDLSKADVAISKSARPLLNVRFCDLNPDGPLSRTSAFGQHLAFPPSAQNCFPHSSAHDPRGSGIEDFLTPNRSEEHTSELQSLMRISYAVFCLKKKKKYKQKNRKMTKQ